MIIGLDLSLRATGYCLENGVCSVLRTKDTGAARLAYFYSELHEVIRANQVTLAVLEGYSMASKGRVYSIGELGGLVRLMLWRRGIKTLIVPPTQLKMFVTGSGQPGRLNRKGLSKSQLVSLKKYNKQIVKITLERTYHENFEDDNAADAYGLMLMGQQYFRRRVCRKLATPITKRLQALQGCELLS